MSFGTNDINKSPSLHGECEVDQFQFLSRFIGPGNVIIDFGARNGAMSRALSALVGEGGCVYAIEPDHDLRQILKTNINLAPINNIILYPPRTHAAVDAATDTLNSSALFMDNSDSRPFARENEKIIIEYDTPIIDLLPVNFVNLITIDCARFGSHVLSGSLAIITKNRPFIFLTDLEPNRIVSILDFSDRIKYAAYQVLFEAPVPGGDNVRTKVANVGVILLPAERDGCQGCEGGIFRKIRSGDDYVQSDAQLALSPPGHKKANAVERRPIIIAISFETPELVEFIIDGLLSLKEELRENWCRVIIFNDSENDVLRNVLIEETCRISQDIECTFIDNHGHIGFIKTMNLAMARARSEETDILLLDSNAMLSRGALRELAQVAYLDPMIGFVCPRSSNSTPVTAEQACVLKPDDRNGRQRLEQRIRSALRYLPRYQFAPTAAGFCLFIKYKMLRSFGALSTDYRTRRDGENDFILRAGRCGFRAALANWAYAYHVQDQYFNQPTDLKNQRDLDRNIIKTNYNEYDSLMSSYFFSENFRAEAFLNTLSKDTFTLAIDLSALFRGYNGTVVLIITLVKEIVRLYGTRLGIVLIGDKAALDYHSISSFTNVRCVERDTDEKFDVILRIGQPFDISEITFLSFHAPVNIYFMLDTIAIDCSHLRSAALVRIWDHVAEYADGIIYNSIFTRDQFRRRFNIDPIRTVEIVSYHSLDLQDYIGKNQPVFKSRKPYILIVGNHFPHKNVVPTYLRLIEDVQEKNYVLIGGEESLALGQKMRPQDTVYRSGKLSNREIDDLYKCAQLIIFPSYYEGFGFPIQKALSESKPIFVQDNALNREIANIVNSSNLYLYKSENELVHLIKQNIIWVSECNKLQPSHNWTKSAQEIIEFCIFMRNNASYETVKRRIFALEKIRLIDNNKNIFNNYVNDSYNELLNDEILYKSLRIYSKYMKIKECIFVLFPRRRNRYRRMRAAIMSLVARKSRTL